MALTIDATAKGASSNSYITLADADTYMDGVPDDTTWDAAPNDTKNRALKTATDRLEQIEWVSTVTDSNQRLAWPRLAISDRDGRDFDQDAIPRPIEEATVELARRIVDGTWTPDPTGLEGFRNVKVGPIDVTPNISYEGTDLPEIVRLIISPYVSGSMSRYTVKTVRG